VRGAASRPPAEETSTVGTDASYRQGMLAIVTLLKLWTGSSAATNAAQV